MAPWNALVEGFQITIKSSNPKPRVPCFWAILALRMVNKHINQTVHQHDCHLRVVRASWFVYGSPRKKNKLHHIYLIILRARKNSGMKFDSPCMPRRPRFEEAGRLLKQINTEATELKRNLVQGPLFPLLPVCRCTAKRAHVHWFEQRQMPDDVHESSVLSDPKANPVVSASKNNPGKDNFPEHASAFLFTGRKVKDSKCILTQIAPRTILLCVCREIV